jgi:hypothetical protein
VRSKEMGILCGAVALSLVLVHAEAQEAAAPPPSSARSELKVGPATVAPHWSRYKYPESIPEGATYYIIVRGDTLWDLAGKYLGNPFLWPQIWDQNRYITDAHWIYPGDPLLMPKVSLVTEGIGEEVTGEGAGEGSGVVPGAAPGEVLYPAIEEMALQCAHYVISGGEDTSLHVIGSEHGATKIGYAVADILYLSRGTNAGVKPGDVFTLHHPTYDVRNPDSGRTIGHKVETTGWVRVILADEKSSTAIVEQNCIDIHAGDYAKPFEKVSIPLILRRPPPDRMTPPSGKALGTVVDIGEDAMIAGTGQLVSVNLGASDGVSPGTRLTVFKTMYPTVPTPRNVIGELAIVSVQERASTARVIYSADAIMNGDRVEVE